MRYGEPRTAVGRWARATRARLLVRARGGQHAVDLKRRGVRLGRDVFIGGGVFIDTTVPWLVSIGDRSTLAPCAMVFAHDAGPRRSTGYTMIAPVTIGQRVYIGSGALVLPGVTIGDDAVIGAGSVVRHDVPPASLAVGVPARVIGTVDELAARHNELMRERPVFRGRGWTADKGVTPARRAEMLRRLDGGVGYIE